MSELLKASPGVKFITIESPYKGNIPDWSDVEFNLAYLYACMRYVFDSGYIPWASHGLYTQKGVLDDKIKEERNKGINGGLSLARKLCENGEGEIHIFTNLGISDGMREGANKNLSAGCTVRFSQLPKDRFDALCREWHKEHLIK